MITRLLGSGFAVLMLVVAATSWAHESPVGLWKAFDQHTGQPKFLIRITNDNGELGGRVERLFQYKGEDPNPVCAKCEGARKDQPIVGMKILTGMEKDGQQYTGGRLLDPTDGKVYDSKMSLSGDGDKLEVRRYIGVPMLGRTQTWERVE